MLACDEAKTGQRKAVATIAVDIAALHIDITDGLGAKGETCGIDRLSSWPAAGADKASVAGAVGPMGSTDIVKINVDIRAALVIEFASELIIENYFFELKAVGRCVVIGHASRPVLSLSSATRIDLMRGIHHAPSAAVCGHIAGHLKGVVASGTVRINPVLLIDILPSEFERLAGQSRVVLRTISSA